jgi:hypothetical protein
VDGDVKYLGLTDGIVKEEITERIKMQEDFAN